MKSIICKACGKEAKKRHSKQVYCCLACAYKDREPAKWIVKTCLKCGIEFKTKKATALYCSSVCRAESLKTGKFVACRVCGKPVYKQKHAVDNSNYYFHKLCIKSQRVEKTCEFCNKKFLVKPSNVSKKHCSRACWKKSSDIKRIHICSGCGAEFTAAYPSSTSKWCSRECYYKHRKINYYAIVVCKNCGKEFQVTNYGAKHRIYCSLKCSNGNEQKIINTSFVNLNKMKKGPISKTELMLKDVLEPFGFIPQYWEAGTFIDYANPETKIAIFVDGVFWHGIAKIPDKKKALFEEKIKKTIAKDKVVNSCLWKNGWAVLRLWDTSLRLHFDECVKSVQSYIDFIVRIRDSRHHAKVWNCAGPGRSFPVNNCEHYTSALRLIGRAKVSEATKSKILACVRRKGKELGCTDNSDCLTEEQFEELIATEEFEDTHEFIEWLEYLDEEAYQYEEETKAHEEAKKARLVK